jgi:hypothetical protein
MVLKMDPDGVPDVAADFSSKGPKFAKRAVTQNSKPGRGGDCTNRLKPLSCKMKTACSKRLLSLKLQSYYIHIK